METEVAWKVTADEVKARNYNLDIKNPHTVANNHGDPEELLAARRAGASAEELSDRAWALQAERPNPLEVLMGG